MAKKGRYIYDWPRPMVTVDAIVFALSYKTASPKILLINRKNEPFKGQWALPGGFVDLDEELETAITRELEEETGLKNIPLEQFRTYGKIGRDPRGRQITIVYMGIIENPAKLKAGDDAALARWFPIEKLPPNMAFDHHDIANLAIKKLKRKKIYRQNK